MTPILSRVLIPLDGSETAESILSELRRIVPRHRAELFIVQAVPLLQTGGEADVEKYLRRTAFLLTNDGYSCRYFLRFGPAADVILGLATEVRPDAIAMTTHGRSGVERLVLGSVAERVLQAADVPVLVARSAPSPTSRGMRESLPVRNFMVPLDGSRRSLGVLESVRSLARPVDAHVTLLHVTEPSPYDGRWENPDETLKEADQFFRDACIPARIEHRKGDPGDEILKAAREGRSDLIAMTTHGRSGPSRWVFGSVTAKVLRQATAPLLVVRRAAEDSRATSPSRGESLSGSPRPE